MLLVSTLDSTIRSMDAQTGDMFQAYTGHKNQSYRSKVTFGVKEATVVFGDEDGKVWTWDVETVSRSARAHVRQQKTNVQRYQGKTVSTTQAHDRTILWTAHHDTNSQLVTASADGTVKVWGPPAK